jgi:2-polyprenyl-3-methyl-5-hydroxy-6-metoxy-1,4-benzoquinol methylase
MDNIMKSGQPKEYPVIYDYNYYHYYHTSLGPIPYDRTYPQWLEFFRNIADRITKDIRPKTVLDVGCAKGFLVESLRDRGVEAFGIDISEYAVKEVRDDIKKYCQVASATEKFDNKYDLITCIEVLEHLNEEDGQKAIENICQSTDDVIFSSTPDDFVEKTHINVQPVSYWIDSFAKRGFYIDSSYNCSFLTEYAIRFRKK